MNDLTRSALTTIAVFFACFTIYKAVNFIDEYLHQKYLKLEDEHYYDISDKIELKEFFRLDKGE